MKISNIILAAIFTISLVSCKGEGEPNASIKDSKIKEVEVVDDNYGDLTPEELHKHVLAHYNLEQYQVGKAKLKFLIEDRPDLIDTLDLMKLQKDFDDQLAKIKESEDLLAEKERKKRMPNATKNMQVIEKGSTTYYVDKSSPKFDSKETFHAYYTKDKLGAVRLHLKIKYVGTQWLDIENYMITADQLDYELKGDVVKEETKGKKKYKHETIDEVIDTYDELILLNAVATAEDKVKAVYIGKSAYKERIITKEQQLAMRNVIDAYLFLIERDMTDLKKRYATKMNK